MAVLLAAGAASAQSTLRVVMLSDLKILDPIWTTAYIVRDHGYMVYDTLLAMDAQLKVKPQMAKLVEGERRQADLHVRAARRAQVPRRPTGDGGRLRRLAQALGRARRHGPEAHAVHQGTGGRRCQDLHADPEGALRHGAGVAGQAQLLGAVHHAQAHRRDAAGQAGRGVHRLGPVRLQEGAVAAGREGGLREVRRLQAAARAALGPGRRQESPISIGSNGSCCPTRRPRSTP